MSAPRRPDNDLLDDEPTGDETLTDELLELPDDLDLEDPLAHLERQFTEDDEEEFEDEITQPLEEVDLSALESLDEDEEAEPEVDINDETLDYPELLDEEESLSDGVLLDEESVSGAPLLAELEASRKGAPQASKEVVLPWETEAIFPDLGLTLPVVLDPTQEQSFWMVAELGNQDRVEARILLPGVEVRAMLVVRSGRKPGLRLGRDVLSGRILISC